MENFQLNDFNLNFDFDFRHDDFTDEENRVIDDIMANPIELNNLFETDAPLNECRTNSSSIFDYLCEDDTAINDVHSLDHSSKNQLVTFNGDMDRSTGNDFVNFIAEPDSLVSHQNVNFDWTTFLDDSTQSIQIQKNSIDQSFSIADSVQNGLIRTNNVIRDNGFVYEELKTLDVPQMYGNLDQKFLLNLKKINESMDYSALRNEHQMGQNDWNIVNNNIPSMKQKLFLMPLHLNQIGTESLKHVTSNIKKHPFILNSILNKCGDKEDIIKIVIRNRPKKIKQKSEQYLTLSEQLDQMKARKIELPKINRKQQGQKRKESPKVDKEKVPLEYNFQVILTNNIENTSSIKNKGLIQSNGKKIKPTTDNLKSSKRRLTESKPSRRLYQMN